MGCAFGFSSSASDVKFGYASGDKVKMYQAEDTSPNPNPFRFTIVEYEIRNGNTVIMAKYPDCPTFGGKKLMVLKGIYIPKNINVLDPHFLENDHPIIARFIPTSEGYALACMVADAL